MDETEISYLKMMNEKLWTKSVTTMDLFTGQPKTKVVVDRQPMSKKERTCVFALFKKYQNELIFDPCGAQWGLGIGMQVFQPPQYPHLPPTFLIRLDDSHMHPTTNAYNRDIVYKMMEPFVYSDCNKQMRRLVEFEELHELYHYDY